MRAFHCPRFAPGLVVCVDHSEVVNVRDLRYCWAFLDLPYRQMLCSYNSNTYGSRLDQCQWMSTLQFCRCTFWSLRSRSHWRQTLKSMKLASWPHWRRKEKRDKCLGLMTRLFITLQLVFRSINSRIWPLAINPIVYSMRNHIESDYMYSRPFVHISQGPWIPKAD